jgi:hypothetical protein
MARGYASPECRVKPDSLLIEQIPDRVAMHMMTRRPIRLTAHHYRLALGSGVAHDVALDSPRTRPVLIEARFLRR